MVSNPSKVKNSSSGVTLDGHISKEVWMGRKIHRLAGSFLFPGSKKINRPRYMKKIITIVSFVVSGIFVITGLALFAKSPIAGILVSYFSGQPNMLFSCPICPI
jgi:hypothetical protein